MNSRKKGKIGEDIAEAYYNFRGFRVIERNFHSHFGEIDLVVVKENLLKFIEVKSIWYSVMDLTLLGERVNRIKLRNIKRAAAMYLEKNPPLSEKLLGFEVLFLVIGRGEIRFLPYSSPLL